MVVKYIVPIHTCQLCEHSTGGGSTALKNYLMLKRMK